MQIKGNEAQLLSGVLRPGDHIDFVASINFPTGESSKHFAKVV